MTTLTNQVIFKSQMPNIENDDEWVQHVITQFNNNGGKESVHVLEVSSVERLKKLKEKGWYTPHVFNKKPSIKKVFVSIEHKEKNLGYQWNKVL